MVLFVVSLLILFVLELFVLLVWFVELVRFVVEWIWLCGGCCVGLVVVVSIRGGIVCVGWNGD